MAVAEPTWAGREHVPLQDVARDARTLAGPAPRGRVALDRLAERLTVSATAGSRFRAGEPLTPAVAAGGARARGADRPWLSERSGVAVAWRHGPGGSRRPTATVATIRVSWRVGQSRPAAAVLGGQLCRGALRCQLA